MFSEIIDSIKNIINPVTTMVDELHTSDEEKGKIKIELEKLSNDFQKMIADLEGKKLDLEMKMLEYVNKLNLVDAQSDSNLQRNWRPIIALTLLFLVTTKYMVDILFVFGYVHSQIEFDANFWFAVGGIWGITSLTRGVEKSIKGLKK
jgi:hypothetical protein